MGVGVRVVGVSTSTHSARSSEGDHPDNCLEVVGLYRTMTLPIGLSLVNARTKNAILYKTTLTYTEDKRPSSHTSAAHVLISTASASADLQDDRGWTDDEAMGKGYAWDLQRAVEPAEITEQLPGGLVEACMWYWWVVWEGDFLRISYGRRKTWKVK
ncbi:hypothetical protein RHSIM_Rhsim08G0170800 [Rhododendron simsii]|uniref:Uncharacterized protein n=1 Tax=Rhododendron simsii TaxID=118357 RepID=A0A834GPI2_RHOSS|nr:hypothetical protein RHSIM_Rhsim08G0170800 [Rhododendron simsii]